jgi:protein transport protein SEC20
MAEQNQQQQQEDVPDHPQFRQQKKEEDEGPVTLGDGTVLKESDKPRNPKKKMWEEGVESAKHDQAQAQATQAQQEGSGQRRKRDEL